MKKLSLNEFAQLVKDKYPVFADKNNIELARAVLQKYPIYSDRIFDPSAPPPPPVILNKNIPMPSALSQTTLGQVPAGFSQAQQDLTTGAMKTVGENVASLSALGEYIFGLPISRMGMNTGVPLGRQLIQKGTFEARNEGQTAGKYFGQAAIAATPVGISGGAVKGAGFLANTGRLALEGAGSGGVYGLQTAASKEAGLSETAGDVATGAIIGALTSAAAGTVLKGGLGIYKAIKFAVKPEMIESLTRGIAPTGARAASFKQTAETVMPDLVYTAQKMGKDIATSAKPLDDLFDVINKAKSDLWGQFKSLMGSYGKFEINGESIAKEIKASINARFLKQHPKEAAAINALADQYNRSMSLEETEASLESANKELHAYYAKNNVNRAIALGDPEIAHVVHEAAGLRKALENKFNELTGNPGEVKLLKQRYGALIETQTQLSKRQAVVARSKPFNLQETIHGPLAAGKVALSAARGDALGAGSGALQYATSKLMKKVQTNEELIRKAFRAAKRNKLAAPPFFHPSQPMTKNLLGPSSFIPLGPPLRADTSGILSQEEARARLGLQ